MKKTAFLKRTLALALSLVLCLGLLPVLSLAAPETDTLDAGKFSMGGSYAAHNFTGPSKVAYYAMACVQQNGMQLRVKNKNEGIVTTANPDGLRVASIKLTFNSGKTSSGVEIYGNATNYSTSADLFGSNKGTLIKTCTSSDLEVTAAELKDTDYKAIGFKS